MSVELALRAAALLTVTTAIDWRRESAPAAARHSLWLLTVAAALMLPLSGLLSPAWSVLDTPQPALMRVGSYGYEALEARGMPDAGALDTVRLLASRAPDLWLAGSTAVGLYFVAGYVHLWRLRRRGRPAATAWSADVVRISARAKPFPAG